MAHNFNHQTNITLGESIKMGIKAPALEDRIFDTWSDANTYIHDENSSAVNGLVLTVINDGENNGGWFVDKRQTNNNQYELILTRIGTGGGGSCDLLIPITYNALKNFRDTNQLVPGCRYRIIDYVTKANVDMYNMDWSQIDPSQLQYLSFSAEHPYDIIVLATDVNKLSEDAKAIQHEGDTYFSDSNLEAWELKYSLDNNLQYSWIQDPFNYGESILPPFPFCYISTKTDGQYPNYQNLVGQGEYTYYSYNLCDNVPQWLQQQIEQYVNISQEYGQDISIEIGDTYYVPYPDDPSYGMVRVACWGLGDQVVYFNRITVLRITINENVVIEFPVVYDYDNPNVWHLEEGDVSMDIGVTFGTEWEIMGEKGEWNKVVVKNTGKIIVEVHGCKGVVFEMKDEFNNKADYDFKNIIYATDYHSEGVYSFDLYIDSNNLMSVVIPDSVDNPTQVVDTYSDVTVNCVYDDWEGCHIPYYNEQQCFVSYDNYLFNYLWYDSNYINVNYIGYNNNGFIDTSIGCPEEIRKKMIEYIKAYGSVTQYLLELYLDYTFSKNYNNEIPISNNDGDSGKKSGKVKRTYKKLLSNVPVKEYKTIDSDKIKNYLENVSEKCTKGKKRVGESRNRLSVLNRIENIRKATVGDEKLVFEGYMKDILLNIRKNTGVRADSNSSPVSAWSSMDASLNIYDWEASSGYIQPIAVAENEVHGYVVNYAESQEEYSQIGCRTLPMIVMHAYTDYNDNKESSIIFNKVASDGYYGVTYIECYWFEGNKLFFPDFQSNYINATSYNAIYNYRDEIASQIIGYPGQYGDKYWQQGDYRALNHRPDANITFEDSDGNELGSFNIGDDQQDDETIVIPTGGGVPTLTWRTPTKDEWSYLFYYRSASKVYDSTLGDYVSNARYINTQINSINGLMLLPDVFELPSGITMNNINVNGSQYIENIYTVSQWEELEGAGCVFLPCGGSRHNISVQNINENGNYWSVNDGYPDESITDSWGLFFNPYLYVSYNWKSIGHSVRLIEDEQSGNFTISERDNKCNIAKSNLQFHCKNKEWRFAENAYDIIGSDNANIAENYDGWIDLFGYGTSGWNSGFNAYQPWSTTTDYQNYISYDLTGDYANADWGIYNMSYDSLATVAYTGNYNDLSNTPDISGMENDIENLQDNVDELRDGYFRGGMRTPTADEWDYIINLRAASTVSGTANARYVKARLDNSGTLINGLILMPDVFELPNGITMNNINQEVSCNNNVYTIAQWEELEGAGCLFLPCGGYRSGTYVSNLNSYGFYSSTTSYDEGRIRYLFIDAGSSTGIWTDNKCHAKSLRFVKETPNGAFSISNGVKADITKTNAQFHCLNKKWRFAEKPYDVIGTGNTSVAENYDGWIDLFGFGTSGWNNGEALYQPWSTSTTDTDYLNHDLTGDYEKADWGVYGTSKSLHPIAFSGDYNDLTNKPTIPAAPVQSDWNQSDNTALDYIKNKPDVASLEDNIDDLNEGLFTGDWRTPLRDEWSYIINSRSASTISGTANARYIKAQINNINGLILLPDVFTLPVGINMVNINDSSAGFGGNIYTISQWEELENAGCIFLPTSGARFRSNIFNVDFGYYWSSYYYGTYGPYFLQFYSGYIGIGNGGSYYGYSVRLINEDNINGSFSLSYNTKGNIAKSNLQYHCLNKQWRFAPNAYDIIGNDNANIAENYNGYIDLFGFGTSGWNSGAVCYQPWNNSINDADYINQSLTGDYKNADWGYNIKKQLHDVAFSGDYNDLVNKPELPNDLLIFYDGTQFVCNMTAQEVAENMFKCLKQRTYCFVNHWYYVGNERSVKGGCLTFTGVQNFDDINIYWFNFAEMENSGDSVSLKYDLSNNTLLLYVGLSFGDDPNLYHEVPITITDEMQEVIDFWTASTI